MPLRLAEVVDEERGSEGSERSDALHGVKVHAHSSVALPLLATFSTSAAESNAAPVTTTLFSDTVMSMFSTPAERS